MCGIMGMILNQEERSKQELESLRVRFSQLLVATQVRGKDAAGAFVVNEGGISYNKNKGPASKLVRSPYYWGLMDKIGSQTLGAIGHTRMATKGCPTCNANNHPIIMKRQLVGVHNGVLLNDEELREQYPYEEEVDSAAIFSALYGESGDKAITADVVADTLPLIEGNMALAFADTRDTGKIFIARDGGRPLYLLEDSDALWLASTPEILSAGLRTMARSKAEKLDSYSVMTFDGSRENKIVTGW